MVELRGECDRQFGDLRRRKSRLGRDTLFIGIDPKHQTPQISAVTDVCSARALGREAIDRGARADHMIGQRVEHVVDFSPQQNSLLGQR